jgi:hypothetical protein
MVSRQECTQINPLCCSHHYENPRGGKNKGRVGQRNTHVSRDAKEADIAPMHARQTSPNHSTPNERHSARPAKKPPSSSRQKSKGNRKTHRGEDLLADVRGLGDLARHDVFERDVPATLRTTKISQRRSRDSEIHKGISMDRSVAGASDHSTTRTSNAAKQRTAPHPGREGHTSQKSQ